MANFDRARISVRNRASAIARAVGPLMVDAVRDVTPVGETGDTQRGWTYDLAFTGQAFRVVVRNPVDRAEWLNESPAHLILPHRPGGFLRFTVPGGGEVFARQVHHPGVHLGYIDATVRNEALWHQLCAYAQLVAGPG